MKPEPTEHIICLPHLLNKVGEANVAYGLLMSWYFLHMFVNYSVYEYKYVDITLFVFPCVMQYLARPCYLSHHQSVELNQSRVRQKLSARKWQMKSKKKVAGSCSRLMGELDVKMGSKGESRGEKWTR